MQKISCEKLLLIFNTMQEGVIEQDDEGNIINWNESALRILNLTPDEIKSKNAHDPEWNAIHLDGSQYDSEEFPSVVASTQAEPQLGKIMGLNFFNGIRWIQINSIPFETENQKIHSITTFVDITDLIERSRLLEQYSK